jgi:hypothetical protein
MVAPLVRTFSSFLNIGGIRDTIGLRRIDKVTARYFRTCCGIGSCPLAREANHNEISITYEFAVLF